MATLAAAGTQDLQSLCDGLGPLPDWRYIRRPEVGMGMVRGRIGGGGGRFNVGDVAVTRSVVALASGETGYGYCLGRDRRKAAYAALFDALWQHRDWQARVTTEVIRPLRRKREDADARARRQAAATKVEFFTMVRGEDE